MPRATSVGMEPLDELCTWDDDDVSDWGRGTYGHPCRECGYDWPDDLGRVSLAECALWAMVGACRVIRS